MSNPTSSEESVRVTRYHLRRASTDRDTPKKEIKPTLNRIDENSVSSTGSTKKVKPEVDSPIRVTRRSTRSNSVLSDVVIPETPEKLVRKSQRRLSGVSESDSVFTPTRSRKTRYSSIVDETDTNSNDEKSSQNGTSKTKNSKPIKEDNSFGLKDLVAFKDFTKEASVFIDKNEQIQEAETLKVKEVINKDISTSNNNNLTVSKDDIAGDIKLPDIEKSKTPQKTPSEEVVTLELNNSKNISMYDEIIKNDSVISDNNMITPSNNNHLNKESHTPHKSPVNEHNSLIMKNAVHNILSDLENDSNKTPPKLLSESVKQSDNTEHFETPESQFVTLRKIYITSNNNTIELISKTPLKDVEDKDLIKTPQKTVEEQVMSNKTLVNDSEDTILTPHKSQIESVQGIEEIESPEMNTPNEKSKTPLKGNEKNLPITPNNSQLKPMEEHEVIDETPEKESAAVLNKVYNNSGKKSIPFKEIEEDSNKTPLKSQFKPVDEKKILEMEFVSLIKKFTGSKNKNEKSKTPLKDVGKDSSYKSAEEQEMLNESSSEMKSVSLVKKFNDTPNKKSKTPLKDIGKDSSFKSVEEQEMLDESSSEMESISLVKKFNNSKNNTPNKKSKTPLKDVGKDSSFKSVEEQEIFYKSPEILLNKENDTKTKTSDKKVLSARKSVSKEFNTPVSISDDDSEEDNFEENIKSETNLNESTTKSVSLTSQNTNKTFEFDSDDEMESFIVSPDDENSLNDSSNNLNVNEEKSGGIKSNLNESNTSKLFEKHNTSGSSTPKNKLSLSMDKTNRSANKNDESWLIDYDRNPIDPSKTKSNSFIVEDNKKNKSTSRLNKSEVICRSTEQKSSLSLGKRKSINSDKNLSTQNLNNSLNKSKSSLDNQNDIETNNDTILTDSYKSLEMITVEDIEKDFVCEMNSSKKKSQETGTKESSSESENEEMNKNKEKSSPVKNEIITDSLQRSNKKLRVSYIGAMHKDKISISDVSGIKQMSSDDDNDDDDDEEYEIFCENEKNDNIPQKSDIIESNKNCDEDNFEKTEILNESGWITEVDEKSKSSNKQNKDEFNLDKIRNRCDAIIKAREAARNILKEKHKLEKPKKNKSKKNKKNDENKKNLNRDVIEEQFNEPTNTKKMKSSENNFEKSKSNYKVEDSSLEISKDKNQQKKRKLKEVKLDESAESYEESNVPIKKIKKNKEESKRLPTEILSKLSESEKNKSKVNKKELFNGFEVTDLTPKSNKKPKKESSITQFGFEEENATPVSKKKLMFKESPITPKEIQGFKITTLKSKKIKKKINFEEPTNVLPKPVWTSSGIFIESDVEKTEKRIPIKSSSSKFHLAVLQPKKKHKSENIIDSDKDPRNFKKNKFYGSNLKRVPAKYF